MLAPIYQFQLDEFIPCRALLQNENVMAPEEKKKLNPDASVLGGNPVAITRRDFFRFIGLQIAVFTVFSTGCGSGPGNPGDELLTGTAPGETPLNALLDENSLPLLTENGDYLLME